jgi:hypothetical protein
METKTKFWSGLGLLGGAYAALFVIANFLIGEPGSGSTGAEVVRYYHDHQTAEMVGVFAVAFAVVALMFFLASLRRTLSGTDEGRHLASVITAGGAVYAVGLMTGAALTVALVDAAKNDLAGTAQTLNVLGNDMWVPVVAGLAMLGLGTGVAALRSATLPKWLGWVSVVFGVMALAGPAGAIAFLVAPAWALVTGIVIIRSARATTAPGEPAAAPAVPQQLVTGSDLAR